MCITAGPATLSNTIVFANRAELDGLAVHVLGYQNEARDHTDKPNAMILPIPSAAPMGPDNMIDTRPFAGFLKTYAETLRPRSRDVTRGIGTRGLVSLGVQVFERGSYTVVLAREANIAEIRQALDALPETKRPEISDALIESFAEIYPGWHLAICCWSGSIKPEPLLWWFEPAFEDVFLPGLDAHDGGPPSLHALVDTDHTIIVGDGHTIAGHGREHGVVQVRTPDHVPAEARALFPSGITGLISSTRIPNGDWWADERHWNIRRERPDGNRRIKWASGQATATDPTADEAPPRSGISPTEAYCRAKGWNHNQLTAAQVDQLIADLGSER